MSPRKSSTSSGNRFRRPRYLAVEVSGTPTLSPRSFEIVLTSRLAADGGAALRFRVMKSEGARWLVEVAHTSVAQARRAWNGSGRLPDGRSVQLATRRTYGTMVKGKQWLRTPGTRPTEPTGARASREL